MSFDYEKCVEGFKYLDTCPDLLPPDAPVGHPHLMDTTNFNEYTPRENLRVADGIATVLFNYDPKALRSFLNLDQPEFEFLRHEESTIMNDLFIGRKGLTVTASHLFLPVFYYSIMLTWYAAVRLIRRPSRQCHRVDEPLYLHNR